jgi:hypothetical protein
VPGTRVKRCRREPSQPGSDDNRIEMAGHCYLQGGTMFDMSLAAIDMRQCSRWQKLLSVSKGDIGRTFNNSIEQRRLLWFR